jgi:hypothetical protein
MDRGVHFLCVRPDRRGWRRGPRAVNVIYIVAAIGHNEVGIRGDAVPMVNRHRIPPGIRCAINLDHRVERHAAPTAVIITVNAAVRRPNDHLKINALYRLCNLKADTLVSESEYLYLERVVITGKYPPAKPGALGYEPLKTVGRIADAAR